MKEIKKCAVCGADFVSVKNKNSTGCCSNKCRQKRNHRMKNRYPISQKEYEFAKKYGRLKHRESIHKPQMETMDDCIHKDCYYRCEQKLVTCDYILYESVRRGCKISECDKYRPRFKGYETEKKKILNIRRY